MIRGAFGGIVGFVVPVMLHWSWVGTAGLAVGCGLVFGVSQEFMNLAFGRSPWHIQ